MPLAEEYELACAARVSSGNSWGMVRADAMVDEEVDVTRAEIQTNWDSLIVYDPTTQTRK